MFPVAPTYGPTHPARYEPFGSGCAGSAGTPVLAATGDALPWLGDTFTREVTNVPSGGAAVLAVGLQTSTWNGSALPRSLQSFGAPGCTLYTGVDVAVVMATVGSTASLPLALPNAAGLLGVQLHDQCLVLDPGINALGAVVSNAATMTLGGR